MYLLLEILICLFNTLPMLDHEVWGLSGKITSTLRYLPIHVNDTIYLMAEQ